jgi:hypothetical protein
MIDLMAEWSAALAAMTPQIELELIQDWGIPSLHFLRKRVLSFSAEILNSAPGQVQARGADRHSPASHDDMTYAGPLKSGAAPSESEAGFIRRRAAASTIDKGSIGPASEDYHPQSSRPPHPYEWPMIGRARIVLDGPDLYQPHEAGEWAFVTPVCRQDPETFASDLPGAWVRWGSLVDLCAWHPASPDKWAVRTGEADWLGLVDWPPESPVRLSRSPASWLRAKGWADPSGPGLVLVGDPAAALPRPYHACCTADVIVSFGAGVVCEDYAHYEQLRRLCPMVEEHYQRWFREQHGRSFFAWP